MSKPLWSDQNIIAAAQINRSESDVVHMLFGMRDSYEQRLADLEAENERLRHELAELRRNHRALLHLLASTVETYAGDDVALAALLPDADTRTALHRLLGFAEWEHDAQSPTNGDIGRVMHWLQRLEANHD